jgi:hypothetical protein
MIRYWDGRMFNKDVNYLQIFHFCCRLISSIVKVDVVTDWAQVNSRNRCPSKIILKR